MSGRYNKKIEIIFFIFEPETQKIEMLFLKENKSKSATKKMSRTRTITPFFPAQMSIELCGDNSTPIEVHQGDRSTLIMLTSAISNGSYENRVKLVKVKQTTGECIQELKVQHIEIGGVSIYNIR